MFEASDDLRRKTGRIGFFGTTVYHIVSRSRGTIITRARGAWLYM